jgi:hypothetical protein
MVVRRWEVEREGGWKAKDKKTQGEKLFPSSLSLLPSLPHQSGCSRWPSGSRRRRGPVGSGAGVKGWFIVGARACERGSERGRATRPPAAAAGSDSSQLLLCVFCFFFFLFRARKRALSTPPHPPSPPTHTTHLGNGDLGQEADAQVLQDDAVGRGEESQNVGDKVFLVVRQLLPVRSVRAQVDLLGCFFGVYGWVWVWGGGGSAGESDAKTIKKTQKGVPSARFFESGASAARALPVSLGPRRRPAPAPFPTQPHGWSVQTQPGHAWAGAGAGTGAARPGGCGASNCRPNFLPPPGPTKCRAARRAANCCTADAPQSPCRPRRRPATPTAGQATPIGRHTRQGRARGWGCLARERETDFLLSRDAARAKTKKKSTRSPNFTPLPLPTNSTHPSRRTPPPFCTWPTRPGT